MNTDNELLKSISAHTDKEDAPDVKGFIFRNLKYWPLLVFLLVVANLLAWLYLRYTPKSYRAEAMIAIKKDKDITSEGGLRISLMDDKVALEKEVELLKSPDAIEQTIKELHLYGIIKSKGKILQKELYGIDAPFTITSDDPEKIKNGGPFEISYSIKGKSLVIDNKEFSFGQWHNTPWGRFRFEKNPLYKGQPEEDFELSFVSLDNMGASISKRLVSDTRTKVSELIMLSVNDYHPKKAVDILKTIVKVYDGITVDNKKGSYLTTYKFIDERLSLVEKELSGVESEIQRFKSSNAIVDLSTQGDAYLQNVQVSDQKIAEVNLQLELVDKAKSYISKPPSEAGSLPAMFDIGNSPVGSQMQELNKTDMELNRQLQLSGPDNPRVKVLEDQSRRLRQSISEGLTNMRSNLVTSRNFYIGKQAGFNNMLRDIPQKEKGLLDITRQQAIKNGIFSFLLQKREESAIAVAATVPNSQFIRRPMYAGVLKPTLIKTAIVAIGSAIFLFMVFVGIMESLRNELEEKQELEKLVGAPIVGELSQSKVAKGEQASSIVVGEGKLTVEAEQFRDLRTNLNYMGLNKDNKVVLVTSSMPGEGKTYVALNLAISLALTGKKVAILALDLRKPKLAKEAGIVSKPGITDYLIGNATLDAIIKPMPGYNSLFMLPEGSIPPNPAELIMEDRLKNMVDMLRERFDYIIFDSPPIGSVTDAKLLASYANSTIFVTRIGNTLKSFYPMIKDAYETRKLPNMGIVVNGIKYSKLSRYGQRYGYGYTSEA
jgi:capsular exopolysaccharide synthesis family protein